MNIDAGTSSLCDYFKTRPGLLVTDSFTNRILLKVSPLQLHSCERVIGKTLPRDMADTEIINEILGGVGKVHKYAPTLEHIKEMISLQWGGEDGELLNNGRTNIFYVLVGKVIFSLYVHRDLWRNKWDVDGWPLDKYARHGVGRRVFVCTSRVNRS
ncbi:MAG: hypothetical protein M0P64_00945 [Candidatus Pacebacteria bacterium]|jgi:hypothetical protein|nr:hypothetical protein [Candidatus Paceibacterota bacterium]